MSPLFPAAWSHSLAFIIILYTGLLLSISTRLRFSKDIDTIDVVIPQNVRALMNQFFAVISTLVVVTYTAPPIAAVLVPLLVVYYIILVSSDACGPCMQNVSLYLNIFRTEKKNKQNQILTFKKKNRCIFEFSHMFGSSVMYNAKNTHPS